MECFGRPLHNQILAAKGLAHASRCPAGFRRVSAPATSPGADVLHVFVTPETTLRIDSDAQSDVHVYLWGLAAHPELSRAQIPRWIGERIRLGETGALSQIIGCYIALVDDRKTGAVSVVSDAAGTRPFFAGLANNALICGSDVWALAGLGWISRRLNYDAIAAWIRAGYDFTEGSLFSDLSLVEPGAVTTWRNERSSVKSYVDLRGGSQKPTLDAFVENVQGIMTRAFGVLTRELGPLQLGLSGGFDSRYVAALAVEQGLDLKAVCLNDNPSEGKVAGEVARRLGLPLKMIETDGSRWNAYDEPFHFAPSGFPITKQQTYPAAMQNPGVPCLNGFLGDGLIRGTVDRLEGKLPSETTEEHARVFQRAQNLKHTFARFDLVQPEMLRRCDARTLPACRKYMARYAHTANVFASAMYLRRHRTYFGNNFVQHLSFAEAVLPFANYELIQAKCETHPDCIKWENYEAIFARFYPKLADIPHNQKTADTREAGDQPSAVTPRWAMKVFSAIVSRDGLRILDQAKTVPRLIGALRGGKKADVVALFTYRIYLLEERLRKCGVELNWDAI